VRWIIAPQLIHFGKKVVSLVIKRSFFNGLNNGWLRQPACSKSVKIGLA
jgi:hypothetical protein